MHNTIVTLQTFTYPIEAYPLMSKLEAEGINCFLEGEAPNSDDPFESSIFGGVNLQVLAIDEEVAMNIISNYNESEIDWEFIKQIRPPQGYSITNNHCPQCDSKLIYKKHFPFVIKVLISISIVAFLFLPILFIKRQHRCGECGHFWMQ